MAVIIRVAITTIEGPLAVLPPAAAASITHRHTQAHTHTHTHTYRHTDAHTHKDRHTPDIRTGSSSLMVFMDDTSIILCSWWVSSCCLSSIIFDIFVIPEKDSNLSKCWEKLCQPIIRGRGPTNPYHICCLQLFTLGQIGSFPHNHIHSQIYIL